MEKAWLINATEYFSCNAISSVILPCINLGIWFIEDEESEIICKLLDNTSKYFFEYLPIFGNKIWFDFFPLYLYFLELQKESEVWDELSFRAHKKI